MGMSKAAKALARLRRKNGAELKNLVAIAKEKKRTGKEGEGETEEESKIKTRLKNSPCVEIESTEEARTLVNVVREEATKPSVTVDEDVPQNIFAMIKRILVAGGFDDDEIRKD